MVCQTTPKRRLPVGGFFCRAESYSQQAGQPGWLPGHSQLSQTLNTCKGVIRCAPLVDCDKEEIISELKPQGVSDVMNISVRDDSGGRRNTNTFIVTFKAPTTPKHLYVGYLRVPVPMYIPNPLHCFKCQKFGHSKSACRGRETCATCGHFGHSNNNCTYEAKCPNCAGSHSAFSKSCPKWLFEKRVQEVKAEKGISFIEARMIASTESKGRSAPGGRTAAAVAGSRAAVAGSRSGPHCQLLVQLRYRLTSRGLRDRRNLLSSLLLHANTPASLHKPPPRNRSLTGYQF